MPEIWQISEICQLRVSAENSRFHSKFRVFEKNIENFRGNLGKNKNIKFGEKVKEKPESGLGIFREN